MENLNSTKMTSFILKMWTVNKLNGRAEVLKSIIFEAENMEDAKTQRYGLVRKNPHTARMTQKVTIEKFTFKKSSI